MTSASLAFSPDGELLAAAGRGRPTEVRNARSGELVARLHTADWGRSVAFSPDGSLVATGDFVGGGQLWSTETWDPVGRPLEAHEARILTLEFSRDGRTLASASEDGTVVLWDVDTRTPVGSPLTVQTNAWVSAAFTPDGSQLFAVSDRGRGVRFDVGLEAWKRHACRVAGRAFTAGELADALADRLRGPLPARIGQLLLTEQHCPRTRSGRLALDAAGLIPVSRSPNSAGERSPVHGGTCAAPKPSKPWDCAQPRKKPTCGAGVLSRNAAVGIVVAHDDGEGAPGGVGRRAWPGIAAAARHDRRAARRHADPVQLRSGARGAQQAPASGRPGCGLGGAGDAPPLPRLFEYALLENGAPNPRHLSNAGYLALARAAALRGARRNGVLPGRVDLSFPGAGFAPTRVTVAVRGEALIGLPGERRRAARVGGAGRVRRAMPVRARATAELAPDLGDSFGMPGHGSGGGYDGALAYRQGKPMRPDVAAAFDRMAAAARHEAGLILSVSSGFRSDAEQAVLWNANPDPRWVAPPGTSLHRDGTELDLGPTAAYGWLAANAGRFGFLKRYEWKPWR